MTKSNNLISPDSIYQLIQEFTILKKSFFEPCFQFKPGFLKHLLTRDVIPERACENAVDIKSFETVFDHLLYCFGSDSFSPKGFCEPITKFRIFALHIALRM